MAQDWSGYIPVTPARNNPEIQAEIDRKTAILLLIKGRELPAYLATMDLRSRIVCVTAIDSFTPVPMAEALFESLLVYPAVLDEALRSGTELSESVASTMDELAGIAREKAAEWSLDDLHATYLNAGHKVADATATRTENTHG